MKKLLLPLAMLAIFIPASLSAQSHHKKNNKSNSARNSDPVAGKTYDYELESNDPVNAPNLSFTINPFCADLYTLNYNLGYSVQVDYRLNNRLNFGAFYRGSYLDRFKTADGNSGQRNGISADESNPVSHYGASVVFFFKNDLSVINEEITLKIHGGGSVQTKYVMHVPAKRLQLWGFRAGYEMFNSSVYSSNGNIRYYGTPVVADTAAQVDPFDEGAYSTYMRSATLAFGICRVRISDIHVNVETFGKKATAEVSELYMDVLYATSIGLSDITVSSPSLPERTYEVNTGTAKSKIGFRMGYTMHTNLKFQAFGSFGVEVGSRPGPKAGFDSAYLMLKFGMNLAVHAAREIPDEVEE